MEFVATKKLTNKLNESLMILSEFSGSNRAFTGFLEFNPFNVINIFLNGSIDTRIFDEVRSRSKHD